MLVARVNRKDKHQCIVHEGGEASTLCVMKVEDSGRGLSRGEFSIAGKMFRIDQSYGGTKERDSWELLAVDSDTSEAKATLDSKSLVR